MRRRRRRYTCSTTAAPVATSISAYTIKLAACVAWRSSRGKQFVRSLLCKFVPVYRPAAAELVVAAPSLTRSSLTAATTGQMFCTQHFASFRSKPLSSETLPSVLMVNSEAGEHEQCVMTFTLYPKCSHFEFEAGSGSGSGPEATTSSQATPWSYSRLENPYFNLIPPSCLQFPQHNTVLETNERTSERMNKLDSTKWKSASR